VTARQPGAYALSAAAPRDMRTRSVGAATGALSKGLLKIDASQHGDIYERDAERVMMMPEERHVQRPGRQPQRVASVVRSMLRVVARRAF